MDLSKDGYSNYGQTGWFQPEYALLKVYPETALDTVGDLPEGERAAALRELLAGAVDLDEKVFARAYLFRPALRQLLEDPNVGVHAITLLASIGVPADIRWIAQHAPPPDAENRWANSWAYAVATAMLAPITEAEWSFLTRCALGAYEDGWVEGGALQSLMLIDTLRSWFILEFVRLQRPRLVEAVDDALAHGRKNLHPLADKDLTALAKRVATAIAGDHRREIESPRYNERGDMARVALNFVQGNCLTVFTAAFQKVDGVWHLRGVRETEHAALAQPIEPEEKPAPD